MRVHTRVRRKRKQSPWTRTRVHRVCNVRAAGRFESHELLDCTAVVDAYQAHSNAAFAPHEKHTGRSPGEHKRIGQVILSEVPQ